MPTDVFPCPLCHGGLPSAPAARWQRCPHCGGQILVPPALEGVTRIRVPCTVCGERVWTRPDEDDIVCQPCFEANLRGALACERPTVANLADLLPVRRRELSALDRARWPLTRGRGEG